MELLEKLLEIPSRNATYKNLNKLRDVINILTYGPERNEVLKSPVDKSNEIEYNYSSEYM